MKIEMPEPTASQKQRSQRCLKLIADAIDIEGGSISFEQYMQICLYAENIGYYESGDEIFGGKGDFTTSPERSHYFAMAFAHHIQQIKKHIMHFSIIEIGAGSGKFTSDLLKVLKEYKCLPDKYIIVEKSSSLRKRQQEKLSNYRQECEIVWTQTIEQPVENAIVIANEVLDALPVKLLAIRNGLVKERRVRLNKNQTLEYVDEIASEDLEALMRERIPQQLLNQDEFTYRTEINMQLNNFVEQIASFVKQGIFFYIDYGYPRSEYYHVQRQMGTLICHFKHAANDQALLWPSLQDISCNVDFTALAEAADDAGLNVASYTTQAHFLLATNILDNLKYDEHNHNEQVELKGLLMPGEMGERFQVMALSKNIDMSDMQFTSRDLLHRL